MKLQHKYQLNITDTFINYLQASASVVLGPEQGERVQHPTCVYNILPLTA